MFSKLSSLVFVVASAFMATSALPVEEGVIVSTIAVEHNNGNAMPAPNVIDLVQVCTEANFGNCFIIFSNTVPSGCINLPSITGPGGGGVLQDSISSAFPITGVQCTLFDNINCGGASLRVGGDIANFVNVGFNDITTSLSCVAN